MGRTIPSFPSIDSLYSASREQLLDLLDAIDELNEKGISAPTGYLFAVSSALMRAEAEMLELQRCSAPLQGVDTLLAGPQEWLREVTDLAAPHGQDGSAPAAGQPSTLLDKVLRHWSGYWH